MTKQTILKQMESCYNPYLLEGFKYIDNIIFYKDGQIVVDTGKGWFDYSNNYTPKVIFDFVVKKANKLNLNRQDAYILGASLYIHTDLVNLQEEEGEREENFGSTQIKFTKNYLFETQCKKNEYIKDSNSLKGYKWTTSELAIRKITISKVRFERNELGRKCDKLAEEFKLLGINLTSYEAEKLIKNFNITKKRK